MIKLSLKHFLLTRIYKYKRISLLEIIDKAYVSKDD